MKYIGMIITLIIMVIVTYIYTSLSKSRNKVRELNKKLDENLRRRWNLVPKLVEILNGYSVFEKSVLEKLTTLRNQDFDKFKMEQKINVDDNISKVVGKIIEITENSPEIKENEAYINLRNQLSKIEITISELKKEYKKLINDYNKKIEKRPNNLVAILFGFNEERI